LVDCENETAEIPQCSEIAIREECARRSYQILPVFIDHLLIKLFSIVIMITSLSLVLLPLHDLLKLFDVSMSCFFIPLPTILIFFFTHLLHHFFVYFQPSSKFENWGRRRFNHAHAHQSLAKS
jgi:amino acid transporter